jgi:hypothetical protein
MNAILALALIVLLFTGCKLDQRIDTEERDFPNLSSDFPPDTYR